MQALYNRVQAYKARMIAAAAEEARAAATSRIR